MGSRERPNDRVLVLWHGLEQKPVGPAQPDDMAGKWSRLHECSVITNNVTQGGERKASGGWQTSAVIGC